jgi:Tol biopolymer transport system component
LTGIQNETLFMTHLYLQIITGLLLFFSATGSITNPPDGEITFTSRRDGNFEIYVMAADGSQAKNVTNHKALDFNSSWSPDGQWVVYCAGQKEEYDIYLIRADGTKRRRLTTPNGRNQSPAWRPQVQPQPRRIVK